MKKPRKPTKPSKPKKSWIVKARIADAKDYDIITVDTFAELAKEHKCDPKEIHIRYDYCPYDDFESFDFFEEAVVHEDPEVYKKEMAKYKKKLKEHEEKMDEYERNLKLWEEQGKPEEEARKKKIKQLEKELNKLKRQ